MPGTGQNSLGRSLAALTIGVVKAQDERDRQLAPTRLGEMAQHLIMDISGTVNEEMTTQVITVTWPNPFVMTQGRREFDFATPVYNYGIELPSDTDVMLLPTIRSWEKSAEGYYTGARVAVKAWAPGQRLLMVKFAAKLHMTFWGYGAPVDDETDESGSVQ